MYSFIPVHQENRRWHCEVGSCCRKRRGAINAKQLAYLERYHPRSRLKSRNKNGHNSCRLMWRGCQEVTPWQPASVLCDIITPPYHIWASLTPVTASKCHSVTSTLSSVSHLSIIDPVTASKCHSVTSSLSSVSQPSIIDHLPTNRQSTSSLPGWADTYLYELCV